jgi:hypothetical protein
MTGKTDGERMTDVKPEPCAAELAVMGIKPPEPEAAPGVPPRPPRSPLLRYPRGESPLYKGVNHVRR